MRFIQTEIPDVIIIEPRLFKDERGWFMESFRQDIFDRNIPGINFVQDNESLSSFGVLRGLHYQLPPFAQAKLIRVITGTVLDVAVDIRKNSPTFGKYVSLKLSESNKRQLFISKGFAHGFVVLSSEAILQYKVDEYYAPDYERALSFDDPTLGINWELPRKDIVLSDKDRASPLLRDAQVFLSLEP